MWSRPREEGRTGMVQGDGHWVRLGRLARLAGTPSGLGSMRVRVGEEAATAQASEWIICGDQTGGRFWSRHKPATGEFESLEWIQAEDGDFEIKEKESSPEDEGLRPGCMSVPELDSLYRHITLEMACVLGFYCYEKTS